MIRATSDLLSNSRHLKSIEKIECLTVENEKIECHMFDLNTGEVESKDQEKADPILNAVVSML